MTLVPVSPRPTSSQVARIHSIRHGVVAIQTDNIFNRDARIAASVARQNQAVKHVIFVPDTASDEAIERQQRLVADNDGI